MSNPITSNGVPLLLPTGINTIDDVVPNLVTADVSNVGTVVGNVAGDAFEPYARIEKQELYNADSFQSRAYNVKVEDTKGDMIEAGIVTYGEGFMKSMEEGGWDLSTVDSEKLKESKASDN